MVDWNALSEAEFRREAVRFFQRCYPERIRHSPHRLRLAEVREWYDALSREGWIAPSWPVEYGGMGLEPGKLIALIEEQEAYGVARLPDHGIIMVGPLLMQEGTTEQKAYYLPKILSGEHIWCQGYSEPNAGSDLASLQADAVIDGDVFIVNGQKTWSTLAQDGTHMFLLVRTDRTARKQERISFLLVDMNTPGITVRPIRTLGGHEEFCEVFFDNVQVPTKNLVGTINKGWGVAKALLGFERLFLGSPKFSQSALLKLENFAKETGQLEDSLVVDRLAQMRLDVADLGSLYRHFVRQVQSGKKLGPEISCLKVWGTETFQRISETTLDIAGVAGAMSGPIKIDNSEHNLLDSYYNSRPATIYGGTSEIQRNIIATAVLNLPRGDQ